MSQVELKQAVKMANVLVPHGGRIILMLIVINAAGPEFKIDSQFWRRGRII